MIYKYTKCESVIAKIMADLDSSETRQRTSDIKEWIFEAIDKIGAPMQYINRQSGVDGVPVMKIQDYQIQLPPDLEHLDGIAFSQSENGPWIPCSTQTSIFKSPHRYNEKIVVNKIDNSNNNPTIDNEQPQQPQMQYKYPTVQAQINRPRTNGFTNSLYYHKDYERPQYFIKPGWIVFNKKSGYVKLSYKAIPTDERGYPLIPDLSSYQEAIYWYVVMKLNFSKFIKGQLGGKLKSANITIYNHIQIQWNFYRNQAYAEAMMPTADDMQNIKNDWNKLIPDCDGNDTFFKYTGDQQLTYNDYYNGF